MEQEKLVSLVLQAQNGDTDAISILFAEYKDNVYSIAMRETKDRALSDDIVQETFVEVILKINDLKNPASFPAWLKIMAYHQCTRHYKKKETVHETAAIENDEGWSVFDTVEETNVSFIPDEALDQKEFKATILEMIDDLPDAQRAALHMFYFEEMPLKVIAKIQGVSVNTANTRLNRGRLAMKDSIEKYEKKHGIRLHSIAFFPFFKWLLKGSEESMSAKSAAQVAQKVSAETGVSIAATKASAAVSGKTAAATGTKAVTTGIWTKVVAGVAAASIAISAPFIASQIKDGHDNSSLQNTTMGDAQYISHETLQSTPEIISEETIVIARNPSMEYYAPVFEQYQMAMSNDFYFDPNGMLMQSNNPQEYLSFLLSAHSCSYRNYCKRHYHESLFDEDYHVYYCLLDLNNDGVEELFVGAGANSETAAIYSLFSYDGVKPIRLADEGALGERTQMTVFDDNSLCIRGSGGHVYNYQRFYIMPEDSLQLKIYKECNMEDSDIYILDGSGTKTAISKEQFSAVWNNEGTSVKSLDWQEIIAEEILDNSENANIKLQDYLDFSKAWAIDWYFNDCHYMITYAFEDEGKCYCTAGWWRSDLFGCYTGSYSVEGNVIHFYMNMGNKLVSYSYEFDPARNQFVQVSDNGLYTAHIKGDTFTLYAHEDYSAIDIKRMATNGLAEYP